MRLALLLLALHLALIATAEAQVTPKPAEPGRVVVPAQPPAVTTPGVRARPLAGSVEARCQASQGDEDKDGYGAPECNGVRAYYSTERAEWVTYTGGDDCDDKDASRNPGAVEIADFDRHDEDCNPTTFGVRDLDGDGATDSRACNVDPRTGESHCGTDCDDTRAAVHHGATDLCDDVDNDCDGETDEGVKATVYRDADRDGFGDPRSPVLACFQDVRPGLAMNDFDCNDGDPRINPITGTCP